MHDCNSYIRKGNRKLKSKWESDTDEIYRDSITERDRDRGVIEKDVEIGRERCRGRCLTQQMFICQ